MNVKGKYLNPKADLTFKLIFGEHKDLVMSLLNALLPLPADGQIVSVEYISNELVPDNPGKKNSIVDVQCKDQRDRRFIVEMQNVWNVFVKPKEQSEACFYSALARKHRMEFNEVFIKRVMLNTAKAIVKQVGEGEDFSRLHPVYSLNLVNDKGFDEKTEEFYHDYVLTDVKHHDKTLDDIRMIFVELQKFKPKSIVEKKMAVLWLRFLTEISEATEEVPAELLENAETSKALQRLEKSAYNDSQLHAYQNFWYTVHSERVLFDDGQKKGLEEGLKKGRAEGLAEGERKGRAEGLAEGERKGRAEGRVEVAHKLKQMGMSVADIAKATGLGAEDIEAM